MLPETADDGPTPPSPPPNPGRPPGGWQLELTGHFIFAIRNAALRMARAHALLSATHARDSPLSFSPHPSRAFITTYSALRCSALLRAAVYQTHRVDGSELACAPQHRRFVLALVHGRRVHEPGCITLAAGTTSCPLIPSGRVRARAADDSAPYVSTGAWCVHRECKHVTAIPCHAHLARR
jgi:hypothetical protein